MIRIGRMDKQVHLQRPVRVVDPDGHSDTWTTYASVRAAVEPATPASIERYVGATIQTPISHLVTIWYRPFRDRDDLPGSQGKIHEQDRVLFGTRALYIAGIQNEAEHNRQLVLACHERAA